MIHAVVTSFRVGSLFLWLAICGLALSGCQHREEIRRYQVPKSAPPPPAPSRTAAMPDAASPHAVAVEEDRMLAAIIPQGQQAWFFKVTGSKEALAPQVEAFRGLIRSVKFANGQPQWQLPDGWRSQPGSGMRFATLEFGPPDKPLPLSVIALPIPADGAAAGVLSNVNRWRGQLQLPPITAEQLPKESEQIQLDGAVATVVDLQGKPAAATSRTAAGPASANPASPPSTAIPPGTIPDGWKPGALSVSRGGITLRHEAAFEVVDGPKRVEITVDRMPGGGGLLPNVNRWRGQVKLEPIDEATLQKQLRKLDVGGTAADYIELHGGQQSILGAIITHGADAWYVKLMGDAELAKREQARFEDYVKSLKLN